MRRVIAHARERIAQVEAVVLLVFCLATGAAFVFSRLMSEMLEGETRYIDEAVLLSLRDATDTSLPVGPYWLSKIFSDITVLGGTTVLALVTVATAVFLCIRREWASALFLGASVLGGWAISSALKLGVARPRPDVVAHLVEVHDFSFPSGHAMLSAATYLTLAAMLTRVEKSRQVRMFFIGLAVFLIVIIGMSRVYLGVHYPTDVLAGWCAGSAWAGFVWLFARRYLRPQRDPGQTLGE